MVEFNNFSFQGSTSFLNTNTFDNPLTEITDSQLNRLANGHMLKPSLRLDLQDVQIPFRQSPLTQNQLLQERKLSYWNSPLENANLERDDISFENDCLKNYILSDTLLEMEQGLDKGLRFKSKEVPLTRNIDISDNVQSSYYPHQPVSQPIHVPGNSRFFVIKSYNDLDIIAGFQNSCWSSTKLGNKRLNKAYMENNGDGIFLFFSVNGSGRFCAVAQMVGPVDFEKDANCWSDPKWKGSFPVKFLIIKDVQNKYFKKFIVQIYKNGIGIPSSVITSRDTQELPFVIGNSMINIFVQCQYQSSFLSNIS